MADQTLKFIIESVFKGAGTEAARDALKNLQGAASGTDAALIKTSNGFVALGGASKHTADLLNGLGINTVALTNPMYALGAGVKFMVDQAAEAETIMAQTEAVIRSTGGAAGLTAQEIGDMAEAMSRNTTFADDEIQKAQNLLLTFTGIGRDVFPQATQALLDMATAMGTDAKSGAIQLGKALNDPVRGMTALTRVGVVFNDEQRKAITTMAEMGDVAGAQKVILAELNKEFGGSAAAALDTYTGKVENLKNKVSNLAESFGSELLPAAEGVVDVLSSRVDAFTLANDALEAGAISGAEYARVLAELAFLGPDASGEIEFLTRALEENKTTTEAVSYASTVLAERAFVQARAHREVADAATEEQTAEEALRAAQDLSASVYAQATRLLGDFNIGMQTRIALEEQLALASGKITAEDLARKDALEFLTKQLELGKITEEEYLAAVNALASGAANARDIINDLGAVIEGLPSEKNIDINVRTRGAAGEVGIGPSGPTTVTDVDTGVGPVGGKFQHGTGGWREVPPGYNENYYIGMSSGERFAVTPRGQGALGGVTIAPGAITVNAAPGQSAQAVAEAVMVEIARRARLAGASGYGVG
jgi:hypothetical protein